MKKTRISTDTTFQHPLLEQLADLVTEVTGLRLLYVRSTESGWDQTFGASQMGARSGFCRLVQGGQDGDKACRTCHVLMALAASSGDPTIQCCHAGVSVLVRPVEGESSSGGAILTSCAVAEAESWKMARSRGVKLGIDVEQMRAAFLRLPRLGRRRLGRVKKAMAVVSLAIKTIESNARLEEDLLASRKPRPGEETGIENLFRNTRWAKETGGRTTGVKAGDMPLLVRVLCELVRQRMETPLRIKELAPAARVTPNYMSVLFRRWTGLSFPDYLVLHRMERAKELLGDLTLKINQVGRLVGYEDPGLFARRFRRQTGVSPREWRDGKRGAGERGRGHASGPEKTGKR